MLAKYFVDEENVFWKYTDRKVDRQALRQTDRQTSWAIRTPGNK